MVFLPKVTQIIYAANNNNNNALETVDTLVDKLVAQIVNPLIGLAFAVAFVYFCYGVIEFIMNRDKEDKRTAGKQHMIWGIIGMAIMVSVFGIINLIMSTIGA